MITIKWTRPGLWHRFLLYCPMAKTDGFGGTKCYVPEMLTAEQKEIIGSVATSVVSLEAPWQATHATVQLNHIEPEPLPEGEEGTPIEPYDVLEITLYARNANGGTRHFTGDDFPLLRTEDKQAISLYKQLTMQE